MSTPGTELATVGGGLACLNKASREMRALKANTETSGLKEGDLIRVKTPSGGALHWALELPSGTKYVESIRGIILCIFTRRTLWGGAFTGEKQAPVCTSEDQLHGRLRRKKNSDELEVIPEAIARVGIPGGNGKVPLCAGCAFNEWGTAKDSAGKPTNGKACKESLILYVLPPDSVLPYKLSVQPGSLSGFNQWMHRLPSAYFECIVDLKLEKGKSGGGIDYAKLSPQLVDTIEDDYLERFMVYRNWIHSKLKKQSITDDVDTGGRSGGNAEYSPVPDDDGDVIDAEVDGDEDGEIPF